MDLAKKYFTDGDKLRAKELFEEIYQISANHIIWDHDPEGRFMYAQSIFAQYDPGKIDYDDGECSFAFYQVLEAADKGMIDAQREAARICAILNRFKDAYHYYSLIAETTDDPNDKENVALYKPKAEQEIREAEELKRKVEEERRKHEAQRAQEALEEFRATVEKIRETVYEIRRAYRKNDKKKVESLGHWLYQKSNSIEHQEEGTEVRKLFYEGLDIFCKSVDIYYRTVVITEKAANVYNCPAAYTSLGDLKVNCKHPALEAGLSYYKKAAELGDSRGQLYCGIMYRNGYGTEQNLVEALKWFLKAAEQGNPRAMCHCAEFYDNGWGAPYSWEKSTEWSSKAEKLGWTKDFYQYYEEKIVRNSYAVYQMEMELVDKDGEKIENVPRF